MMVDSCLRPLDLECLEEAVLRPLELECLEQAVLRPLELECFEQAVLRPLDMEGLKEAVSDTGVRTASARRGLLPVGNRRYLRRRRGRGRMPSPPRLDELDSKVLDVFVFNSHVLDVLVFNSNACLRLLSF